MSDVKWLVKEKKSRMHSRVINSFPGNVVYGMRTFFIIHKLGFSFGHFEKIKPNQVKKVPKLKENSQGFSELSQNYMPKMTERFGLFLTT